MKWSNWLFGIIFRSTIAFWSRTRKTGLAPMKADLCAPFNVEHGRTSTSFLLETAVLYSNILYFGVYYSSLQTNTTNKPTAAEDTREIALRPFSTILPLLYLLLLFVLVSYGSDGLLRGFGGSWKHPNYFQVSGESQQKPRKMTDGWLYREKKRSIHPVASQLEHGTRTTLDTAT